MTPEYTTQRNALLADPSTPFWMSSLIQEAERHDPFDAWAVLDTVTQLFKARIDEYQGN